MPSQVYSLLFGRLHGMTHSVMSEGLPHELGFAIPNGEGMSKAQRAAAALDGLNEIELATWGRRFAAELQDAELEEAALKVLERDTPPITDITRRDLARVFGDDLTGEAPLLEVVGRWFSLQTSLDTLFGGAGKSLRDQIKRHMIDNPGDWSVEYLFQQVGAVVCSRSRFVAFLEDVLHPRGWRGEAQAKLVQGLSPILRRDGYELVQSGTVSGHPVFAVREVFAGVTGRPKNLIFASRGPKPEIGFADAINNDIVILSNQESCLVYDRPIGDDGLTWAEVVDWWAQHPEGGVDETAARLGKRLQESLDSKAEHHVFAAYFKHFRALLGGALPALVPQVYLHYDPAIVKTLRGRRESLPRQRMDFLLLLPNRQRVVIEVDGTQHFAQDGQASLPLYAQMVSADRELRLAGYEVYRFGANELLGSGSDALIADFFERLFERHRVART